MRSDASFEISDPSQIRALRAEERDSLDEIISSIISSGANVVCCQKGMDDEAVDRLSNAGVLVLKRVKNTDMRRLERSTAAKTVDDINELTPSKLGKARVVERKIGRSKMVLFEDCPFHKSSAIVIRGNDIHVLEGIVSEVKSALHCTAIVSEDQRILPGGGAVEIEVARRLRKRVSTIAGKEKLGVEVFASALEVIPRVLVKNAGMDPLDCVAKLRSEHEGDNPNMGICVEHRRIMDMLEEGVIEPLYVKSQAINSAASVAMGMLRIDDLVIAKQKEKTGLRMEYEAPEFKYRRGRIKY
jgi:chaperonin GroEL (HSP60 family)